MFHTPPYKVENVFLASSIEESFSIDWGLSLLNIPKMWEYGQGEGVTVAILDSASEEHISHTSLKHNLLEYKSFIDEHKLNVIAGHGIHVTGIVSAKILGVSPKAKFIFCKVMNSFGQGTEDSISDGLKYAITKNVDIIVMSFGSRTHSEKIHNLIKICEQKKIICVAAAGNEGPNWNTVNYPAAYDECISVGAIDENFKVTKFSSRGEKVDILAPGEKILSSYPVETFARISGSSQAAPFVVGVLANWFSYKGQRRFTTSQVNEILHKTAINPKENKPNEEYGWGIINPNELLLH